MALNEILKLLADDTRTKIITLLQKGEICVCDLAEKLDIEQSLLSHHLSKLKDANLVSERKVGRWVHYSLKKESFETIGSEFSSTFGVSKISDNKCIIHPKCCDESEDCCTNDCCTDGCCGAKSTITKK